MEKSYDEKLAKLMSEARDLLKSANYLESAHKYLEAAKNQEISLGLDHARDLYMEAIQNFIRAAEDYKDKKQYRKSAEALYYVSQIYKHLGAKEDWKAATNATVEELLNAANDYFSVWNEYDRAIVLVTTSCFFLFLVENFEAAEKHYFEYLSKIQNDPGFTFAQQVLYTAGYAIKAVKDIDTQALINAQQLLGSHLKPSLRQLMGDLFLSTLDEAMEKVVKIFRSKIKLPKIIPELKISRDLVINQITDLTILLENEGEGDAYHIQLNVNMPEDIEVVDGNTELQIEKLVAGEKVETKLQIRCMSSTGDVKADVSANLTFYDQLQTKQSMIVGPYELLFREISISKELRDILAEKVEKVNELQEKVKQTTAYPTELIELMFNNAKKTVEKTEKAIGEEKFDEAKGQIEALEDVKKTFEKMIEEEFKDTIITKKEAEIEEKVIHAKNEVEKKLKEEYETKINEIKEEHRKEIENLKEQLEEEKEKLKAEFKQQLEEEKEKLKEQLQKEKQEEMKELMTKLDTKHKEELNELKETLTKEKEKELKELERKLEEEKRKALEEQETVLREEFQKQLSKLQQGSSS